MIDDRRWSGRIVAVPLRLLYLVFLQVPRLVLLLDRPSSSKDMNCSRRAARSRPCLDCFRIGTPVSVPDLAATAHHWPAFTAAAEQAGTFQSVHALPLRLRREAIGALNLFHRSPGPLPEADLLLGQALADVATIGILQERSIRGGEVLNEQLQGALISRVVIEQAKGVLAQQHQLSMDAAFDRLCRYSRNHNLRLAEIARRLATGELNPATITTPVPTGHRH